MVLSQTTISIDDKLRRLAKKHGLNASFIARKAIAEKVAECEIIEERRKKGRDYATMVPFEADDLIFDDDKNGVVEWRLF